MTTMLCTAKSGLTQSVRHMYGLSKACYNWSQAMQAWGHSGASRRSRSYFSLASRSQNGEQRIQLIAGGSGATYTSNGNLYLILDHCMPEGFQ